MFLYVRLYDCLISVSQLVGRDSKVGRQTVVSGSRSVWPKKTTSTTNKVILNVFSDARLLFKNTGMKAVDTLLSYAL